MTYLIIAMLYIHKKAGETMDQLVNRVKKVHFLPKLGYTPTLSNESIVACPVTKLGYTARLDPMAKGIVPFVTNDLCTNIKSHLGSDKTYQVKIIIGIQTDSDDPLGLITNFKSIREDDFNEIWSRIINYLNLINNTTFHQKYHHYSTKMLNHRRQKTMNVVDNHQVYFYDYEILGEDIYDYRTWSKKVIGLINSIDPTKNFRQEATIKQWEDIKVEKLYYLKLKIKVSSGFFVRQLIRDISENIGIPLMCYNINRVSID